MSKEKMLENGFILRDGYTMVNCTKYPLITYTSRIGTTYHNIVLGSQQGNTYNINLLKCID